MSLVEAGRHWWTFLWERQERRENQLSLCSSLREHGHPPLLPRETERNSHHAEVRPSPSFQPQSSEGLVSRRGKVAWVQGSKLFQTPSPTPSLTRVVRTHHPSLTAGTYLAAASFRSCSCFMRRFLRSRKAFLTL